MAITVVEKLESRTTTAGDNPSGERVYLVFGVPLADDDHTQAENAVAAEAPATHDGLPRRSIEVEPLGAGSEPSTQNWTATVQYNRNQASIAETGDSIYSFDTGGGTQHITQSKQTIHQYAPDGLTAPDFKGAIGVTEDGVEGVDITVPVFQFTETHYISQASVTTAYKVGIFNATGKTNSAPFRSFAAGEVLFLGASGSIRTSNSGQDWEITFKFAVSPNVADLAIGDITGIDKKGWEYLWVRYADVEDPDAQTIVKRPVAAYVERVYDEANFSVLGI